MKARKPQIALLLLFSLALCGVCLGAGTDYSQDVAKKNGDPSPVDVVTGSSVDQFTAGETNSRVDDYLHQEEQINVNPTDGIIKVLRTNQKVNINDYVPKMIPLKKASARELRVIAREIAGMEGGTAEAIIDPKSKENFVYVVVPRFQLPYIEEAIRNLDEEWLNPTDDGTVTQVYFGKYRDVRAIHPLAFITTSRDFTTVAFDVQKNTVTVTEDPDQMKTYLKYAAVVDIPANEITVEAKFIEVEVNNDLKMGLDWIAWKNGPGRNLFEFIYAGQNNSEHYRGASSIFNPLTPYVSPPGDGGHEHFETTGRQTYANFNYFITSAYLDFLQTKGKAKVLVAPKLQTVSGHMAEWASVDPVASISVTGTDNKTLYNTYGRAVAFDQMGDSGDLGAWDRFVNYTAADNSKAGVFLDILPFVGRETTEMFVNARIASVTGLTPKGEPILAERSITTDVRAKDGQTLVLGGLQRTEKVKQKAGAPWLSEIPVLGYIFGSENKIDRSATVLVTLNTVTSIGSASKMEMPKQEATVISQVTGPDMPGVPNNPFGFDQWLIDPEKAAK